ncbi:MAG: hypothetical protein KF760_17105 [Candidatus Eremiobacteraeota bacterium]|nr:hypothetical protein [Candidatus Eremiobacteraeota bacterium]MCW5869021.1 hypothetical protein [Candidatus Eremiobacteraeota bacterium]
MKKLVILTLAILLSPAYADVRYTKKVTFNHGDTEGMSMQTTTFLKNKRERIDTVMQAGPMKIQQSELTLCDLEKRARLDSELKIYTSRSLRPQLSEMRNPMEERKTEEAPIKPGSGTYTMTYKVQDLGVEKVAGLDTRHYRVQCHMVSTGCAGDSQHDMDREVWVADLPRLQCPILDASSDFSLENQCQIKVIQQGDVQLYLAAMKGEPVKEILYQEGKPMMTTELTDYSSAALEDALFSLDGLKAVSEGEFQQQMQAKMMRQFLP